MKGKNPNRAIKTARRQQKIEELREALKKVEDELGKLSQFRVTKSLREFKTRLLGEKAHTKRQLFILQQVQFSKQQDIERKRRVANINRSEKMKRSWRYFQTLKENYYPDKSVKEIRSLFSKHRKGIEVEIPDVAWRNPSP